jgi:hypothetical protein
MEGPTFEQERAQLVEWARSSIAAQEARQRRIKRFRAELRRIHAALESVASAELQSIDADLVKLAEGMRRVRLPTDTPTEDLPAIANVRAARRLLEESAAIVLQATSNLPAPQSRPWTDQVAHLYLMLRRMHGLPIASHADSPAVTDFVALLQEAGHFVAPDTAHRYLIAGERRLISLLTETSSTRSPRKDAPENLP